jgi:hypothetical protein
MAYFDVSCPECNSKEKVRRKRHSGIRYEQFFDDTGLADGEFRYYHLHCYACENLFYIQERHFYEAQDSTIQKSIVPEENFQKASKHKPGTVRIGTTASQYTVMIAAGADQPYALRRLAFN